jgi:hypothetical protein
MEKLTHAVMDENLEELKLIKTKLKIKNVSQLAL